MTAGFASFFWCFVVLGLFGLFLKTCDVENKGSSSLFVTIFMIVLLMLIVLFFFLFYKFLPGFVELEEEKINKKKTILNNILLNITNSFNIPLCNKCNHNKFKICESSGNGNALNLRCLSCSKKSWYKSYKKSNI